MAGNRHSKSDMELGRKARKAARDIDGIMSDLGFDDAEDEAAKALKSLRPELKGILSDDEMDKVVALWAGQWTIESAACALMGLAPLLSRATDVEGKADPGLVNNLLAALRGITSFVDAKLSQIAEQASEGDALAVKAFGGTVKKISDYTLKGTGVCYGGQDLAEDTFTKATDFGQSRSFVGMPVFYDHALGSIKSQVGTVKAWEATDDGLVFEVELDKHKNYVDHILKLADKGALGFSTGALSHTVVRDAGELKRWIIGEISLTPTPAEPRTLGVSAKTATSEAAPEASNRGVATGTVANSIITIKEK